MPHNGGFSDWRCWPEIPDVVCWPRQSDPWPRYHVDQVCGAVDLLGQLERRVTATYKATASPSSSERRETQLDSLELYRRQRSQLISNVDRQRQLVYFVRTQEKNRAIQH